MHEITSESVSKVVHGMRHHQEIIAVNVFVPKILKIFLCALGPLGPVVMVEGGAKGVG